MSNSLPPHDYAVHGILQARILKWVAFPFSRRSSQPRDRTHVSYIAGRFFTSWDSILWGPILYFINKLDGELFITTNILSFSNAIIIHLHNPLLSSNSRYRVNGEESQTHTRSLCPQLKTVTLISAVASGHGSWKTPVWELKKGVSEQWFLSDIWRLHRYSLGKVVKEHHSRSRNQGYESLGGLERRWA